VHRSPDDADLFLLYEVYDDTAAYEAHANSEHFAELARERGFPLLADRRREFYELVSDGTEPA
jgi:quinol monooxygenase YgiN